MRIVYLFPCLLWRCLPHTWTSAPSLPARINHWMVGREERKALDDADAVIVQSQSVVHDILDFHPQTNRKLVIAPTGVRDLCGEVVATREAVREKLATPNDAVVAVAVGHLDRNKNFEMLIEAVHRVNQKRLRLWIVGEGPMGVTLKRQAARGPASGRIHFLGSRKNIADIYAAADVLLHAAWYDNFPNVYLEAMVSGLPIVGPKGAFPEVISPLSEIIKAGVHGHMYSLDRPEELCAILDEITAQPDRARQMGAAARELALDKYGWQQYIDAVEGAMLRC